jgi:hypothetical protein
MSGYQAGSVIYGLDTVIQLQRIARLDIVDIQTFLLPPEFMITYY